MDPDAATPNVQVRQRQRCEQPAHCDGWSADLTIEQRVRQHERIDKWQLFPEISRQLSAHRVRLKLERAHSRVTAEIGRELLDEIRVERDVIDVGRAAERREWTLQKATTDTHTRSEWASQHAQQIRVNRVLRVRLLRARATYLDDRSTVLS